MSRDNEKIYKSSQKLENKKRIYDRIYYLFEEFSNYQKESVFAANDILVQSAINEKIHKITSYIEEYKFLFYENYQIENKNNLDYRKVDESFSNSFVKNSKMVKNPQKMSYLDNFHNTIKDNTLHNSFNNFVQFYGRNSIHKDLKT